MAEYLQGDVSGHWEIVSFTNSSHLCFCYSIGIPNFQGLFWPNPCCPLSRFPPHPWLLQLLLRTKRDSVNSGLSPINHTPALDASQLCIYCHVPTTPSALLQQEKMLQAHLVYFLPQSWNQPFLQGSLVLEKGLASKSCVLDTLVAT